jgi:hypothetical protein
LGKRLEHAVSGINGAVESNILARAQSGGIDAGALLEGVAGQQETGKGGNNAPGLDQIISGLAGQNQAGSKNQSAPGEREQAKQKEEAKVQESANAQQSKGNVLDIQIEQTTVKEANGQERKTEVIKDVPTQPAVLAPAVPTPPAKPAMEAPPPPPEPKAETPAKGKPAKGKPMAPPPLPPAPIAEASAKGDNNTAILGATESAPETHVTQTKVEKSVAVVSTCETLP